MRTGHADPGARACADSSGGVFRGALIGVLAAAILAAAVLLAQAETAAAAKAPTAAVASKTATVNSNRTVKLLLRCNRAGLPCRGAIILRPGGEKKRIARKAFRVPSGRGKLVAVRLSRAGYARLQAADRLRVRAIASTRRAQGKAKKRRRNVLLLATPAPATAPAPRPSPADKPPTQAADRARAARIALKLSDLPGGWEASADTTGAGAACSDPDLSDVSGRHAFTLFRTGLATSAGSDVSIFKTTPAAIAAYNTVPAEVNACFVGLVGSTIDGAKIENVRVSTLASPGLGDRSRAFRIEIDADAGFLDFTLVVDVVYILRERALAVLLFSEILSPIAAAIRGSALSAVVARMAP